MSRAPVAHGEPAASSTRPTGEDKLEGQPSQASSFFFTATFFSVTYLGRPSLP